jgi:hypothetical protein
MHADVENTCIICKHVFMAKYKKRDKQTCSKDCAYALRMQTRKTVHDTIVKVCCACNKEFNDTSKKKLVKKCAICIKKESVDTRNAKGSYARADTQNQKVSDTLLKKYESGWDPYTKEHKENQSQRMKDAWATGEMREKTKDSCMTKYGVSHWAKSDDGRKQASDKNRGRKHTQESKNKMAAGQARRIRNGETGNLFSNCNGGFRKDINLYVRSNWEANFARILNLLNISWSYEAATFKLMNGMSYTPDFIVNGEYYEIKGIWTDSGRLKVDTFRKEFPTLVLHIVDGEEYNEFRNYYKNKITWEGK